MKYLYILLFVAFFSTAEGQICPGEAGVLKWHCWQDLFDSELGELTSEENYPLRPDFIQNIYRTQSPINFDNNMGSRIEGFISVGQTDNVTFNVTGDDFDTAYVEYFDVSLGVPVMGTHVANMAYSDDDWLVLVGSSVRFFQWSKR